jgi:hypothetical protein
MHPKKKKTKRLIVAKRSGSIGSNGQQHVIGQKHEVEGFKEYIYTYRCISKWDVNLPANNNHLLLRLLHTAFNNGIALTGLDIFFFGIDVNGPISLEELVFV